MSLKNTEEVLNNFIKSNIPQVLVIKGAWGSGKTYFLEKEFLTKHRDDRDLGFKKYSYVSLFGLKSIQDIKFNLFENLIDPKQIGDDINLLDVQKNYKIVGKKIVGFFRGINTLNEYSNLGWWFLNTKENTLIVIDDFERINKNIDVDEVLGLISELKEKRKCKIILVMNDEKIDSKALEDYKKFKEKVIDIEIDFKPTPEECSGIIFNDQTNGDKTDLKFFCVKLGITNIRIISKIQYFYNLISPCLDNKEYHEDVKTQTKSSLVFLINSFYGNPNNDENSEIPGIEFVLEENSFFSKSFLGNETKEPEFSKKWRKIFLDYEWYDVDDFDMELFKVIKRGYIIREDLFKVGDKRNEEIIAGNFKNKYHELWNIHYHCGFKDNEDEFVNTFLEFYQLHSEWLDVNNLNESVGVIRRFGRDEECSQIIDFFIEKNASDSEKLNLRNFSNHTNFSFDEEIKTKINETYHKIKLTDLSPVGIIEKIISDKNSITDLEENILFGLSEDDILRIINSVEGDLQREYIEALLIKRRISNASEEWKKLTERTLSTVKQLDTCKINHSRLESYGFL